MNDEDFDVLLDGGLKTYSDCAPRTGLEERVLQRVYSAGRARRWAWLGLVPVVAALAGIWLVTKPVMRTLPPPSLTLEVRLPETEVVQPLRATPHPGRRTLPQQEQFPAPEPLSVEERALMRFVKNSPDQVRDIIEARARDLEKEEADLQDLQ